MEENPNAPVISAQGESGISPSAFEGLVVASLPMLRRYCGAITGNAQDADDIVQETYIAVQRSLDRYDSNRDFGAWLRGIARNIAAEKKRRIARRARLEVTQDPEIVGRMEDLYRAEETTDSDVLDVLAACLEKLSDPHRRLITDVYVRRLKLQNLAQVAGKTVSWAKMTLLRVRQALADCVLGQMGEPVNH